MRKIVLHPTGQPEIEFVGKRLTRKAIAFKGHKHAVIVYLSRNIKPLGGFFYVLKSFQKNNDGMNELNNTKVILFKSIFDVIERLDSDRLALEVKS